MSPAGGVIERSDPPLTVMAPFVLRAITRFSAFASHAKPPSSSLTSPLQMKSAFDGEEAKPSRSTVAVMATHALTFVRVPIDCVGSL